LWKKQIFCFPTYTNLTDFWLVNLYLSFRQSADGSFGRGDHSSDVSQDDFLVKSNSSSEISLSKLEEFSDRSASSIPPPSEFQSDPVEAVQSRRSLWRIKSMLISTYLHLIEFFKNVLPDFSKFVLSFVWRCFAAHLFSYNLSNYSLISNFNFVVPQLQLKYQYSLPHYRGIKATADYSLILSPSLQENCKCI